MATNAINKLKSILNDRANLFVIKVVGVYAVWKLFHYYIQHSSGIPQQIWLTVIEKMGGFYAVITSAVLNIFGEETIRQGIKIVYIHSQNNIRVEDHCLAIPAMVIFTFSIALFNGTWKNKLWFIPLGLLGIFIINVIRLVSLSYIFEHFTRKFYDINHSLIYVVITYALVFLMIMWWMKKYDDNRIKS
jgi:exosortase/archaeosortase family protein